MSERKKKSPQPAPQPSPQQESAKPVEIVSGKAEVLFQINGKTVTADEYDRAFQERVAQVRSGKG